MKHDSMAFKVFLSHSMNDADAGLLDSLRNSFEEHAIELYLAEDHLELGDVPTKIQTNIDSSDLVVILFTQSGSTSQFVNQEVAWALKGSIDIVLLTVPGVQVNGFIHSVDRIIIDPKNPDDAMASLIRKVKPLKKSKETRDALIGIGLAAGAFIGIALLVTFIIHVTSPNPRKIDEVSEDDDL